MVIPGRARLTGGPGRSLSLCGWPALPPNEKFHHQKWVAHAAPGQSTTPAVANTGCLQGRNTPWPPPPARRPTRAMRGQPRRAAVVGAPALPPVRGDGWLQRWPAAQRGARPRPPRGGTSVGRRPVGGQTRGARQHGRGAARETRARGGEQSGRSHLVAWPSRSTTARRSVDTGVGLESGTPPPPTLFLFSHPPDRSVSHGA